MSYKPLSHEENNRFENPEFLKDVLQKFFVVFHDQQNIIKMLTHNSSMNWKTAT
jgi:hypothetical protein